MGEVLHVELHERGRARKIHLSDELVEQRRLHVAVLQHVLEGRLLDVQLVPRNFDTPLGVRLLFHSHNVIWSDGECAEYTTNVEREDGP